MPPLLNVFFNQRFALVCATIFFGLPLLVSEAQNVIQTDKAKDSETISEEQTSLHEKLAKYLTNSRWQGQFTITGKDVDPKPEQYEITEAIKAKEGDTWNLVVRIKYGDHDTTLPLPPIEIKWAGETPVITVDAVTIPGLGTFDARVLIRAGKYAGTWAHDDVGGHLFGSIEKIED
jgi:hypothetical protein